MEGCSWVTNTSFHWQRNVNSNLRHFKYALQCIEEENLTFDEHHARKDFTVNALYLTYVIALFVSLCTFSTLVTVYENLKCGYGFASRRSKGTEQQINSRNTKKQSHEGLLRRFLRCFCLMTNGADLLRLETPSNHLHAVDGIRVIGILWIFMGHLSPFFLMFWRNLKEHEMDFKLWYWQFLMNLNLVVDIFFLLSGFLNARSFFDDYRKNGGKIDFSHYYLKRFVRLTPAYVIVFGFYTFIFPHLGSGALWPAYAENPACKSNWWKNLLYIHNFFPGDDMCMTWSWFLAADVQFYVFSPLIFVTLLRWSRIGYTIIGAVSSGIVAILFTFKFYLNMISSYESIVFDYEKFLDKYFYYFDVVYTKPYAHVCPYLLGILLAYHLSKRQPNKTTSQNVLLTGWLLSAGGFLYCFFGLYYDEPSLLAASLHTSLKHVIFPSTVAWLLYACINSFGGVIGKALSWTCFVPFGRLTYSTYLIHYVLIYHFLHTAKRRLDYDLSHTIYITAIGTFFSFLAGFIVAAFFEYPSSRIYSLIRARRKELKHKQV